MALQLRSALQCGQVKGAVGHIVLDGIDTTGLQSAVHYAQHLGCKTVTTSQLLATAQVVLRLRQVFLTRDMAAVREVLDTVTGKVLSGVAAEEVQVIKGEADNWYVVSELTAAISSGMATVRETHTQTHMHTLTRIHTVSYCAAPAARRARASVD